MGPTGRSNSRVLPTQSILSSTRLFPIRFIMGNRVSIRNEAGQSLVMVLVSVAIVAIMSLVMASLFSTQARESRGLMEKLGVADLSRIITTTLASSDACKALFAPSNLVAFSMPFDASAASPSAPVTFAINQVPSAAAGVAIASAGQKFSPDTPSLVLLPASPGSPGLQIQVTSPLTANLIVSFDQSKLVRAIHTSPSRYRRQEPLRL